MRHVAQLAILASGGSVAQSTSSLLESGRARQTRLLDRSEVTMSTKESACQQ